MRQSQTSLTRHWKEALKGALRSYDEASSFFETKLPSLDYNLFIPLNFAEKIKQAGPESALWKQFIPMSSESETNGLLDPIGDKKNAKGNGIIHRYQSRILFTPTISCPIICRYCFRKNELSSSDEIYKTNIEALKKYLTDHPEVNEVILTGGDPLMLSNTMLEKILELLADLQIPFVRFHTRMPVIIPERIDTDFVRLIKAYQNKFTRISFILHTNHASELDLEIKNALKKLKGLEIERRTQSVLLKGINDNLESLYHLMREILDTGFTPYYLHHPDQARGTMHFTLPKAEGAALYNKLRDLLPGWAIPHYVVDGPAGSGKQIITT